MVTNRIRLTLTLVRAPTKGVARRLLRFYGSKMNSHELADAIAVPIQVIGMSYYFDPATAARASELGLNVFEYYGLGRGGTLGNVDTEVVFDAFTFFSPGAIDMLWTQSKKKADPIEVALEHVQSAYAYADKTFADLDETQLQAFADATRKVVAAVPYGKHQLVDGYRKYEATSARHQAYLGAILLRELRGCVHIDAVKEAQISPADAAYLENPTIFKMHGYQDSEVSEVNAALEAKKKRAEEITTDNIAKFFDVLSDDERLAVHDGAFAMDEAIKNAAGASV